MENNDAKNLRTFKKQLADLGKQPNPDKERVKMLNIEIKKIETKEGSNINSIRTGTNE